jgi:hypothetical protein
VRRKRRAHRGLGSLRDAAERFEDAYDDFDRVRRFVPRDSPLRATCLAFQVRIAPEWAEVLDQLGRQRDADRVRSRAKDLK